MTSLLVALLLSSAPFPPPQRVAVTDALKCDWGTVVSESPGPSPTVTVRTADGPVVYQVTADTPALGPEGQQRGTALSLKPGTKVRVYFVIDNGARVTELDDLDGT